MAASLVPFTPSPSANFQFQLTLDGQQYNAICTFNPYGQRYYVNIYDTTQTLALARPVVPSPNSYDISITLGFFATKLVYRESTGNFEVGG